MAAVYFDNNATTHLDPRVLEAMQPYLEGPFANPSSLHRFGRAARDGVEAARAEVAALVGAQPEQVLFTSGGTEADNLALHGVAALAPAGARVLYGATEHAAVLEYCEALDAAGRPAEPIAVDAQGRVDWPAFERQLAAGPVALVALMRANNETGVIQDIPRAAQLAHAVDARLLVDAVQAAGKMALDFGALGADLLVVSAHKIHGLAGVGALVRDPALALTPLHHGGSQERGVRGGTENTIGIVGFGEAARLAREELGERRAAMSALRQRLEAGLAARDGITVFGSSAERIPNTAQFAVAGWQGEALLMALDRQGFALSSGSACHAGSGEPSHVLLAMGVDPEVAHGAVRVSFSHHNTEAEVDRFLSALEALQAQALSA